MNCQTTTGLLDGYVDGELDLTRTLEFEEHLKTCAQCRAALKECENLRRAIQLHAPYFTAPAALEQEVRARLGLKQPKSNRVATPAPQLWRVYATAASILVLLGLATFFVLLRLQSASETLAQQVVSSHVRSLMANHLTDVPSSDQHTVKPWFSGKLDYAPIVKDLTPKGFTLIGGRLDYLDYRPVAALVYKRRQHTINLFLWPSAEIDAKPKTLTIRGYNLISWTQSHVTYWAVSDLNGRELSEFVHDQEQ